MRCIIASDFHLKYKENADDVQRRHRVERFLTSLIGNVDMLVLAGDVFDVWVEWKKVIIKEYFGILMIFSLLRQAGARLVFISGNHDFMFGDFLTQTIGFEVYDSVFTDTINGKKVFVSHGDLFTANDTRYKLFRKLTRAKIIQMLFKSIHPELSLSLAGLMSRSSRGKRDKNLQAKEAGLYQKAKELSAEYDLIVFGHSHNPLQQQIDKSVYINSGDWLNSNSYCEIDDNGITLKYFEK